MKRTRFQRLVAIALSVALLLPCVMNVPAQAAGAVYNVLYSWDPADYTAVESAGIMKNNVVPRSNYVAIESPTANDYGTYSNKKYAATMATEYGEKSLSVFSMYNGIHAKGGMPSVAVEGAVTDRERKTTEALTISLGTFEMDPTNYLAEGSTCKQSNGLYVVSGTVCEEHADGTALTITKLAEYLEDGAYVLPTGTYYLAGDVTVSNQFKISSGTVTLCLNGNTLTNNYVNTASGTDGLFRVSGGELIITDTAEGGGDAPAGAGIFFRADHHSFEGRVVHTLPAGPHSADADGKSCRMEVKLW